MARFCARSVITFGMLLTAAIACAQKAPAAPEHPWDAIGRQLPSAPARRISAFPADPSKIYTLADLVNLAEENNPSTRVAWEDAKARAADLGIAKAALYPTLAAVVLAESARDDIFFAPAYYRQTTETFSPAFTLDYTIFDFGRRSDAVSMNRSNLLAANFSFNNTHRTIIFQVMHAYYQLLDTKGQQDAAEANLKNAQTVQQAAEARLQQGLATLPDVLEARSAAAQADYDLQAAIGAVEIAHGDLATALGISPTSQLQVESIQNLKIPQDMTDTVEASIDRALAQRPDLMQQVEELRAADSEVKAARTAYLPTLSIDGVAGLGRTYGEQNQTPGIYSPTQEFWNARLSLTWTLFDGLARKDRLAEAKARQKQAAAAIDVIRDQVENGVWSAYSTARTALRQQKAAAALLTAATESYNAALQSYKYGVRSQIDVVSAQRTLAEARTADVTARTQLLNGMASLDFQTGDLLHRKGP
ncbi:MAG TPA: TolC family protein [Acidobacteriaceae bacterium]|nr:TolC family protein [Acidobacteriaceae bacterium]